LRLIESGYARFHQTSEVCYYAMISSELIELKILTLRSGIHKIKENEYIQGCVTQGHCRICDIHACCSIKRHPKKTLVVANSFAVGGDFELNAMAETTALVLISSGMTEQIYPILADEYLI
jgi:hypothetical protein